MKKPPAPTPGAMLEKHFPSSLSSLPLKQSNTSNLTYHPISRPHHTPPPQRTTLQPRARTRRGRDIAPALGRRGLTFRGQRAVGETAGAAAALADLGEGLLAGHGGAEGVVVVAAGGEGDGGCGGDGVEDGFWVVCRRGGVGRMIEKGEEGGVGVWGWEGAGGGFAGGSAGVGAW
jgi:hypothetical protein